MDEENIDTEPLLPKPMGYFDASGEYELSPAERRERNHYLEMGMGIGVPYVCFTFLLLLFSYYQDMKFLVWLYVLTFGFCSLIVLCLGGIARHGLMLLVSVLTLSSLFTGVTLGVFLQDQYLDYYSTVQGGHTYDDVDPLSESSSKQNAGVVNFASGTFIDDFRTIGYIDGGTIYCIAPVAKETKYSTNVQFWATGKNCCLKRSHFHCGNSLDSKPKKSIVAHHSDFWGKAANMAASVYKTNSSSDAIFLDFVDDPSDAEDDIWADAVFLALLADLLHLAAVSAIVYTVFKAMPEKMMPEDAVDFMKYYASEVTDHVHKQSVDSYKQVDRQARLAAARTRNASNSMSM
jgi:hypothetical protein